MQLGIYYKGNEATAQLFGCTRFLNRFSTASTPGLDPGKRLRIYASTEGRELTCDSQLAKKPNRKAGSAPGPQLLPQAQPWHTTCSWQTLRAPPGAPFTSPHSTCMAPSCILAPSSQPPKGWATFPTRPSSDYTENFNSCSHLSFPYSFYTSCDDFLNAAYLAGRCSLAGKVMF